MNLLLVRRIASEESLDQKHRVGQRQLLSVAPFFFFAKAHAEVPSVLRINIESFFHSRLVIEAAQTDVSARQIEGRVDRLRSCC